MFKRRSKVYKTCNSCSGRYYNRNNNNNDNTMTPSELLDYVFATTDNEILINNFKNNYLQIKQQENNITQKENELEQYKDKIKELQLKLIQKIRDSI